MIPIRKINAIIQEKSLLALHPLQKQLLTTKNYCLRLLPKNSLLKVFASNVTGITYVLTTIIIIVIFTYMLLP